MCETEYVSVPSTGPSTQEANTQCQFPIFPVKSGWISPRLPALLGVSSTFHLGPWWLVFRGSNAFSFVVFFATLGTRREGPGTPWPQQSGGWVSVVAPGSSWSTAELKVEVASVTVIELTCFRAPSRLHQKWPNE